MALIGLLWRVLRRRWTRRVLFWLVVRLIRLFGLRRAVRLLFSGRGRWRLLAGGLWRAAIRLLRAGGSLLALVGWRKARAAKPLRTSLRTRLARRRHDLRRAALTAVGVDPEWRPARKRRAGGSRAIERKRTEIGERVSGA